MQKLFRWIHTFPLLLVVFAVVFAGCAKNELSTSGTSASRKGKVSSLSPNAEDKKGPESGSAEAKAGDESVGAKQKPEVQRLMGAELKSGVVKIQKCLKKYVEQLEIDRYREGELTITPTMMNKVCGSMVNPVHAKINTHALAHEQLDTLFFLSSLLKDEYQRMRLYALRVGTDSAKNTKKLKKHWVATRREAKAFSRAVDDWEKLEPIPTGPAAPSRELAISFLKSFSKRFKTYLVEPVKGKTAIYYSVAKFLAGGLERMKGKDMGLSSDASLKLKVLSAEFDEVRAYYKDFDIASKSKKDRSLKVRRAVKALLASLEKS